MLACDTSEAGIGAVLAHQFPDGMERPICYVSRSLSKSEKKLLTAGESLHLRSEEVPFLLNRASLVTLY